MKKSIKIVLILFLILSIFTISNTVLASPAESAYGAGESARDGDTSSSGIDYKNYTPGKAGSSEKIQTMAGKVLGIIRNIGVVVSIIALTLIGFKYMMGSVEQKAEYKKSMIPFVIGIILLATSTTLVKIIYDVVT